MCYFKNGQLVRRGRNCALNRAGKELATLAPPAAPDSPPPFNKISPLTTKKTAEKEISLSAALLNPYSLLIHFRDFQHICWKMLFNRGATGINGYIS